jgi:hypothetical protein
MSLINEREVVFLVVSCDRYSDLWTPFFAMMQKMWPDCPYRQYLMTNEKDFVFDGVTVIKTGPDVDYSSQVRRAVEQIDSRWLILWLEDCIISRPVDTARLHQIVSAACAAEAGYLKLSDDYPLSYDGNLASGTGLIPKNVRYRSAVGMSLYRRDVLFRLFPPGKSAWELDKSSESNTFTEDFYCLTLEEAKSAPIKYINTVIKGSWYLPAVPFLRRNGFSELLQGRPRQTTLAYFAIALFLARIAVLKRLRLHWFE